MDLDVIPQEAQKLVADIGLPEGMLEELIRADDWTFVVKSAALCEAAMGHSILRSLGEPALGNFVQKLAYRQKLDMVKALGLLEDHLSFMKYIAELRNPVVHDIRRAAFDLRDFLKSDENIKALWRAIPFCTGVQAPGRDIIVPFAKATLWLGLVSLLAMSYLEGEASELKRRTRELARIVEGRMCPVSDGGAPI